MGRSTTVWVVIAGASFAAACTTPDAGALRTEREAAMHRWSRCVTRHADVGGSAMDGIDAVRGGCDGHRRDVARTFAPHLEPRVQATLGERERLEVLGRRVLASAATSAAAGSAGGVAGAGAGDAGDAGDAGAATATAVAADTASRSPGRRLLMRLDTLLPRYGTQRAKP